MLDLITLIFGRIFLTKRGKSILVRKRLLHKGFQVSDVAFEPHSQENIYFIIGNYNTIDEVNRYLINN